MVEDFFDSEKKPAKTFVSMLTKRRPLVRIIKRLADRNKHLQIRRRSSVGQSIRFIPEVSLVQIRPPLPKGPLVKRSRHRPFTAKTGVRFSYGSPIWVLSSAGRAHASHAWGRRFKSCSTHQCGINSVVECHLAKVKVASPNLVSRSSTLAIWQGMAP